MTRTLALALLACGCATTVREARAIIPSPTHDAPSASALPASVPLYIYQRDLRLSRDYQLRNSARFVVVNRDRLRFHVSMVGYDDTSAATEGWTVWLEDETGRHIVPEAREVGRMNRIAVSWKLYPWKPGGDAWCREPPCYTRLEPDQVFEVYEGQADYVFHEPGLVGPARQVLSLVLRRGRDEFRYTWRLGDGTEVQHYGRTKVDDEVGTISVPGPQTEVAGVHYEDGR